MSKLTLFPMLLAATALTSCTEIQSLITSATTTTTTTPTTSAKLQAGLADLQSVVTGLQNALPVAQKLLSLADYTKLTGLLAQAQTVITDLSATTTTAANAGTKIATINAIINGAVGILAAVSLPAGAGLVVSAVAAVLPYAETTIEGAFGLSSGRYAATTPNALPLDLARSVLAHSKELTAVQAK